MKFFHELTKEEREGLRGKAADIQRLHPEPPWCGMAEMDMNPVDPLGCWGLIFGHVFDKGGEPYCLNCEYHKANLGATNVAP